MDGGIGALILMMPWKRSGFSGSSCSMSAYGSVASNAASCLSRSSMCSLARSILRSTPVRSVGTHASLRRQRGLLRAVQRDRQLGEDREVRVKAHTLDPSHPQGSEAPFVLQPPEGSLYRRAAPVEAFEAQSLARDEGVQSVGLDPHRRGLALAGRAPPLGRVPLVVGSGKAPLAVLAAGRLVLSAFDGVRRAQWDPRDDASPTARVIQGPGAIHIHPLNSALGLAAN